MINGVRSKRAARRDRGVGTPAVVFLDDCRWNAFHQLAPSLRRAGVRTVRVSTEGLRKTHVTSRLLFDRYAIIPDPPRAEHLRAALEGENVVDIQFAESLGRLVHEIADVLDPGVVAQLEPRVAIVDKLEASRRFARAGIRVPAIAALGEAPPAEIAERFGLPVAVKARVGYGGQRVLIAHDVATMTAATDAWGHDTSDLFYEQFVSGAKLDYAAAVGAGGIEQEIAYRVTKWHRPVGRATEVLTIDDPQLVDFGRRVVQAAGCTGLVNMDVIRDAAGNDWMIDFNARAFGGLGSFLEAGIDASEGYLRALGLRTAEPGAHRPAAGRRITVFPTVLEDVIDSGKIGRTARAFMRTSHPYLRRMGARYWLSEAFVTADQLHRTRRDAGDGPARGDDPASDPSVTRETTTL